MNPLHQQLLKLLALGSLAYIAGESLLGRGIEVLAIYLAAYLVRTWSAQQRLRDWLDGETRGQHPNLDTANRELAESVTIQLDRLSAINSQHERDLAYFRESFNVLDSAVIIIDAQGRIDWANRAATTLVGIRLGTDRGESLFNLVRNPAFLEYLETGDFQRRLTIASPLNPECYLEVQASVFQQSNTLVLLQDVSEARSVDKIRQDFIANVSHELRTPLTVIVGYLETLKDSISETTTHWERPVEQMLLQTQRMDAMVEDLIWLSRLESLPADDEQNLMINIEQLLTEIVDDARVSANGKTISLDLAALADDNNTEGLHQPLAIRGSHAELRSALANLLQNALKFSGDDARINIDCGWQAGDFSICVSDNGVGIDPIHIPRLTERFYRADSSRSSDSGGTGLGLAIVKHALGRHDAELRIHSKLGEGSRFCCDFPRSRLVGQNTLPGPQ